MNIQQIKQCIAKKQSPVVWSADMNTLDEIICITRFLHPYICGIKLHADTLDDFSLQGVMLLRDLANSYGLFLIADRKFADIGHTVQRQFECPHFGYSKWADMVTVHTIMGEGTVAALSGLTSMILIAEGSPVDSRLDAQHREYTHQLAQKYASSVVGFITQTWMDDNFLHFTPGIGFAKGDSLGQHYVTPTEALSRGSDVLIIGRFIHQGADPVKNAQIILQSISQNVETTETDPTETPNSKS